MTLCLNATYHDLKFSDRCVLANSAEPDQTAPRSSLIRFVTVNDLKFFRQVCMANSAEPDQTAPRSSLIRVVTVCHFV